MFSPPSALTVSNLGAWRRASAPVFLPLRNFGALRLVSAPEIIISRTSRNNNDLPCYEIPFRWHGERYLAKVARTESAMLRQAFGRIGGKGPAGPTMAAVLRSSRTASVRRRWTGQNAMTKRRSSPSSNRVGQARPFPTSARRPVVAGQKVRGNKAQGL